MSKRGTKSDKETNPVHDQVNGASGVNAAVLGNCVDCVQRVRPGGNVCVRVPHAFQSIHDKVEHLFHGRIKLKKNVIKIERI
jgi:hypothetical protein